MLRKSANCVSAINPGACECVCGGEKLGTILRVSLLRRSQPAVTDTPPPPLLLLMPPVGRNLGARHRQIERGRERERETCTTAGSGVCQRPVEPGTAGGDRSESGGSRQTRLWHKIIRNKENAYWFDISSSAIKRAVRQKFGATLLRTNWIFVGSKARALYPRVKRQAPIPESSLQVIVLTSPGSGALKQKQWVWFLLLARL